MEDPKAKWDGRDLRLPLRRDFRLVHEPLDADAHSLVAVGDQQLAKRLARRLRHSDGGAFLITGFRGVGKTTCVREALRSLANDTGEQLLAVELPLARSVAVEELLFAVVRRLYERLDESRLRDRLTHAVCDAIDLAYARTSYSMKDTRSLQEESSRGLEVGGDVTAGVGRGGLKIPGLKVASSRKRTSARALELSFLAYSASDVEHDLLRILALLQRRDAARRRGWRRLGSQLGLTAKGEPLRARVIVIFDEVDKLTASERGQEAFEQLISALKNLLGTSGIHFIIIAGVDSHDAWIRDVGGPDSIYRSVFAWHGYAGCIWNQASELLSRVAPGTDPAQRDVVSRYLEFVSRGVPRSLHAELNELVEWDEEEKPEIVITSADLARVDLFAELQSWVSELIEQSEYADLLAQKVDEDRIRLSAYYAVDWILQNGAAPFDVSALLRRDKDGASSSLRTSKEVMDDLLEKLVEHKFLNTRDRNSPSITMAGEERDAPLDPVYWLSDAAHERLRRVARGTRGRAHVRDTASPLVELASGARVAHAGSEVLRAAGYVLERVLGVGGVGTVWQALDPNGMRVAVKVITTGARREHPKRELLRLNHRSLVRTIDVLEDPEVLAIVMDLVGGANLAQVSTPLTSQQVGQVLDGVLDGLIYIESCGLARADIKPENIVLRGFDPTDSRPTTYDPVIVDLDTLTRAGVETHGFFGTRLYSAPESLRGAVVDIRSDIYSLGITGLALLGETARDEPLNPSVPPSPSQTFRIAPPDPRRVDASTEFQEVLARSIAADANERFQTAREMQTALRRTPELIPTVWD